MAACAAPPWPSQQRAGRGGTSERHCALARMRERHARAERVTPDPDLPQPRMQQPRAPVQPRSSDSGSGVRPGSFNSSDHADLGRSRQDAWAPAWSPDVDDESPPPKPRRPTPPEESGCRVRPHRSEKPSDDGYDGVSRSNRVRGPAAVKTARDSAEDDECLPPGAQLADFKTLHAMIARGIQDSEAGAVNLESHVPRPNVGEDDEELRFRERQRQRRDQETAQREKEREQAKEKRRREREERERRQAEELEREEREELSLCESRARAEAQCRKELAAAVQIQTCLRGRWSRMGKPSLVRHGLKAVLHWEPLMNGSMHQR